MVDIRLSPEIINKAYERKDKEIKMLKHDLKWTQRLLKAQERANVILVEKDSELRALLDKHGIDHSNIK